jgi:hypothetical protein
MGEPICFGFTRLEASVRRVTTPFSDLVTVGGEHLVILKSTLFSAVDATDVDSSPYL